jgi:SEC-C motif-containing protein
MRARYSAFAVGDAEFLLRTGPHSDRTSLEASLKATRWLKLQVEWTEAGEAADETGMVAFSATFMEGGQFGLLHERSRFGRVDGQWRYLEGESSFQPLPVTRNDPCPCGSGKKSKSCHPG